MLVGGCRFFIIDSRFVVISYRNNNIMKVEANCNPN
jgi:hypothetical protein